MRVLFIVQGEGRGHLTQAISLAQILQKAGHSVIGAWVSVTENRPVASFFSDQFTAPIHPLEGPGLVYCPRTNALNVPTTLRRSMGSWKRYRHSMRQLRDAIRHEQPDVVVNFFELLGGLTYALYDLPSPMVCVAHQYLTLHPEFPLPKGRWLQRLTFKWLVRATSFCAYERLGLSFDQQADVPQEKLRVVPPLLRQEVTELNPVDEPFVLAYTTQPGLQSEVLEAHRDRPDVPIHYFHSGVKEQEQQFDDTLTYHRIDGKRYLEAMERCRAVVSTAGFESLCEALYLGKPVLMIPQPNHYEQMGNALDGQRAGVGLASHSFDLNRLLRYLPTYNQQASQQFRGWYEQGYFLFLSALTRAAESEHPAALTSDELVISDYPYHHQHQSPAL
ncbi:MAG: glycosyl transferase [Cytophagales bacterium]|nr:MAG: glycosyl transferase [Cytophagales bacterium]